MKVETIDPKPSFKPIQITLETIQEASDLMNILADISTVYAPRYAKEAPMASQLKEQIYKELYSNGIIKPNGLMNGVKI